jgi:1,4-dihydroxy-2-naphthoate octaprenyltransferase
LFVEVALKFGIVSHSIILYTLLVHRCGFFGLYSQAFDYGPATGQDGVSEMKHLIKLARLQFLSAGIVLYAFGAFWAVLTGAPFSLARLLFGYLVLLPAHLSISFSNDYFDVSVDSLGTPTFFSGGSGILVKHPELREPAKWIAVILIVISLILGVLFMTRYAFPAWFLGYVLLGNLSGWFYAAPPLKLAYRNLAEATNVFASGFLIPGMGYLVMKGTLDSQSFLFLLPLALYGLVFIISVEIPDEEMDRQGNKHTLVTRKGRKFGFNLIGAALISATLFFFIFPWLAAGAYPVDFRLLGLFSLIPLCAGIIGVIRQPQERGAILKVVNGIVVSLALFYTSIDIYLGFLAIR